MLEHYNLKWSHSDKKFRQCPVYFWRLTIPFPQSHTLSNSRPWHLNSAPLDFIRSDIFSAGVVFSISIYFTKTLKIPTGEYGSIKNLLYTQLHLFQNIHVFNIRTLCFKASVSTNVTKTVGSKQRAMPYRFIKLDSYILVKCRWTCARNWQTRLEARVRRLHPRFIFPHLYRSK